MRAGNFLVYLKYASLINKIIHLRAFVKIFFYLNIYIFGYMIHFIFTFAQNSINPLENDQFYLR
ncbi:hypothetical protein PAECIP111890_00584 [Paenibacillus sp. JJ-223]|nr:hypothetical protein PAECIP111890_00584 [Paenibacillus sp. JJ-223]